MSIFRCTKNAEHNLAGVNPKFCAECGAPTNFRSCECGNILTDTQKFCENCGLKVVYPRDESAPAQAARRDFAADLRKGIH